MGRTTTRHTGAVLGPGIAFYILGKVRILQENGRGAREGAPHLIFCSAAGFEMYHCRHPTIAVPYHLFYFASGNKEIHKLLAAKSWPEHYA